MSGDRKRGAARQTVGHRRRLRLRSGAAARSAMATAGLVVAVAATLASPPRPILIWNVSESAPLGLYRVDTPKRLVVGDMVAARVPRPWRQFAGARHYVPVNVPLIKRIAAIGGDRVCATGPTLFVNGAVAAQRRRHDGAGRTMPAWSGCVTLRRDQYLLLMPAAASFDGRYFGPTRSLDLLGRARLLWER